jgi:hypothetical protein
MMYFFVLQLFIAGVEKPDFEPSICLSMHERAKARPYDSSFLVKAGGTGSILSGHRQTYLKLGNVKRGPVLP